MRHTLLIAAILALALVGGCSASEPEESADAEELPAEFVEFKETVLAHEDAVAECMRDEGFEYVADVPADLQLEEAAVVAEQEGRDPAEALEEMGEGEDPNGELLESLSESEQEAWHDALWGPEGDPSEVGCFDSTYEAVWGIDPRDPEDGTEDIADEIEADPRVVEAEEDYLSCMHDRGYEIGSRDDLFRMVQERQEGQEDPDEETLAWVDEAYENHDECRAEYQEVYEEVYLEHFEEDQ